MPQRWIGHDGQPVSCTEKIRVLEENHAELAQVMQDAFDDALLMGVDENEMRRVLSDMVATLKPLRR